MPTNLFQRMGDFFEQRREQRAAALTALRRREGLPLPVDRDGNELTVRFDDLGNATYHNAAGEQVERVCWRGAGRDGKPGGLATGKRQGLAREDASRHWYSHDPGSPSVGFDILDVAEDGTLLADELRDLDRDAAAVEQAGRVSHGPTSEQVPGLELRGLGDEEVDRGLQAYIQRGERGERGEGTDQ